MKERPFLKGFAETKKWAPKKTEEELKKIAEEKNLRFGTWAQIENKVAVKCAKDKRVREAEITKREAAKRKAEEKEAA